MHNISFQSGRYFQFVSNDWRKEGSIVSFKPELKYSATKSFSIRLSTENPLFFSENGKCL